MLQKKRLLLKVAEGKEEEIVDDFSNHLQTKKPWSSYYGCSSIS